MGTDSRAFARAVGIAFTCFSGCVAHSTASDLAHVEASLRGRGLSPPTLSTRSDDEGDAEDPAVRTLLTRRLSAESAVRIAILNNRGLRADLHELGVARGQLVQASVFPNVEFEAQVRFSEDPSQGPQWDFDVGFDLAGLIVRGARQGVAEAELDAARFRAAGATLDLGYRARVAFYEVQAAAQRLELAQTSLRAFTASYEAAEALAEAGNLTPLDRATERSAYEGARIAVAEAEVAWIDAREQLNAVLGLFGSDTAWEAEPGLPEIGQGIGDLDRLESRAIEASVELAESKSALTAAARAIGLAETAGWLPDLSAVVHAEHDGTYWEIGPGIRGTIPVADRSQGAVISRRAEFDALRERYIADAIDIRAAVRAARARVISAQERARHYRDVLLPLREQVVAETLLQYNAMQLGVFQLLQARRDQIDAARGYIDTLFTYWTARAALEQLLAGRFSGVAAGFGRARDHSSR